MTLKKTTHSLTFLLFALFFSLSGQLSAQYVDIKDTDYPIPTGAYYVSPDGVATNSGKDISSPWPLKHAIENAPAGSTLVLRGGDYRDLNFQKIPVQLTLQAYPHEKPWIKGSVVVPEWVADNNAGGAIWRHDGWTYQFPKSIGNEYIDPKFPLADNRDMVFINDQALVQVDSLHKVRAGRFYVDYANDKIYIGNDPTDKKVESTRYEKAFVHNVLIPEKMVIRGLGFAHFADSPISFQSRRILVENNTFAWNGRTGVSLQVWQDGVFRGNTARYNGLCGVSGNFASRTLVEGNLVSNNNVENFRKAWAAAGMKVINTRDLIVRDNVFENNNANGLWLDVGVKNVKVVRNTVRFNGGIGIFFEISNGALIAGNLSVNNGNGIMIANAANAKIYNNTLANNNMIIKEDKRTLSTDEIRGGSSNYVIGTVIKNNIFSTATGSMVLDVKNDSCQTNMVDSLNYNAYYRLDATKPATLIRGTTPGQCVKLYPNLESFRADFPRFEKVGHSLDLVGGENPFFMNGANGDYRLKAGSPAVSAGSPLPADVAEALGWPAGVRVDMGAFQTVAPAAPAELTVTKVTHTQISLNWKDLSDNETGFVLEVASGSDSTVYASLETLSANVTEYVHKDLKAGITYYYRLRAVNTAGASAALMAKATTEPYGTGLLATYTDKDGHTLTRLDSTVHFAWGEGSPAEGINTDHFTVRWEGRLEADYTEAYTFHTTTDDGVRLWVDGKLLIDNWQKNHKGAENKASIDLQAGQKYDIRMEYYEHAAFAQAALAWESKSQPRQIVPKKNLYPAAQPAASTPAPEETTAKEVQWKDFKLALYPNPVSEYIQVDFSSVETGEVQISLTDKMGQPVLNLTRQATAGENHFTLPVGRYRKGIYLLTIKQGGHRLAQPVLITE